jgi:uncharacterized protein YndB with AHSA1/START domain
MSTPIDIKPESDRELVLARIIDAPPASVYRCWTEPELMKQWFAPKPWTTPHVETDVRAGGSSLFVMRSPEGQDMPNRGLYLEVIPNKKIVATDAFTSAWEPSQKPFMIMTLTFEDHDGGKTKYVARVLHWNLADKETHEKMGFHQGWGICADQLEELAKTVK